MNRPCSRKLIRAIALTLAMASLVSAAPAIHAQGAISTPPPVSGRSLSQPEQIRPADVLARVELLRGNVDLIRRFMGKAEPPSPLLEGAAAHPSEVYSQALNLELRANRLAFEQVRVVRRETMARRGGTIPADVFSVVDAALASVLLVKQDLGIPEPVAEQVRPQDTKPTDVFNAVVAAGAEINNLLEQQTSPSDVFQSVTAATHIAATLHALLPGGGFLPEEPAFEPNKYPADVLMRMRHCHELVAELARRADIDTLTLTVIADQPTRVTPNDVSDMAALLVEHLTNIHATHPEARQPARAYYPGKRFPSHVYQRIGLLEAILEDLVAGSPQLRNGA